MAPATHAENTLQIPIHLIWANHEFNARNSDDGKYDDIDSLAAQIEQDGLLSAVMVRVIPEDEKEKGQKEVYELIYGYRRMAAVQSLGMKSIKAQVREEMSEEDAYIINLAENISRKDLTDIEKADRFLYLKQEQGMTGYQIAKRIGCDRGHVNNLIRIVELGNPKIVKLWREGHGKAGTDSLIRYIVKTGRNHDDQWDAWQEHIGANEEERAAEKGSRASSIEDDTARVKRPSPKQVENAYSALKENEEYSEDWLKGAAAALKFTLGKTKTLPKVYDPRRKITEE